MQMAGWSYIFMMRQFYKTIPSELSEAAKIDGAGHFYIYSKVMFPLIKPILATIALVTFKGTWSDFQGPLLYLSSKAKYTLQLGLNVFKGQGFTDWNQPNPQSPIPNPQSPIPNGYNFIIKKYFINLKNNIKSKKIKNIFKRKQNGIQRAKSRTSS